MMQATALKTCVSVVAGRYTIQIQPDGIRIAKGEDMEAGVRVDRGSLVWELIDRILELTK